MRLLALIGDNLALIYDAVLILTIVGYCYYKALSDWPEQGDG